MLFYAFSFILAITLCNAQLVEKTVKAVHAFNKTCLDIAKSPKTASKCEFFRCFEDRFPCGTQYWNLRWGMRYCKKYSDPEVLSTFTPLGRKLLNQTNTCVGLQLEKTYQKDKSLKCRSFYNNAFKIQSKCYAEDPELFCKSFPENRIQFSKVTDVKDYMDSNFLSMIKGALSKCDPPIDLFSLMSS
jgi:hypothetical protein